MCENWKRRKKTNLSNFMLILYLKNTDENYALIILKIEWWPIHNYNLGLYSKFRV